MSQSTRTRLVRVPKKEEEIHVITNPSETTEPSQPSLMSRLIKRSGSRRSAKPRPGRGPDGGYEAPLTSNSLSAHSHWLTVRRNLHRIRFMGLNQQGPDKNVPSFYLGLQMKRELKRAQEEIKNIDQEANFHAVKHFVLAINEKQKKTYNTSHVKPNDALVYDRLGEEPLALQNLLYYFSKQDVPHGTIFWDFLNEVNRVLNMQRKRTVLVQRLRKLALTLAIICYCIIGLMFFTLIISVITTTSKMNDPEVQWVETDLDKDMSSFNSNSSPF